VTPNRVMVRAYGAASNYPSEYVPPPPLPPPKKVWPKPQTFHRPPRKLVAQTQRRLYHRKSPKRYQRVRKFMTPCKRFTPGSVPGRAFLHTGPIV